MNISDFLKGEGLKFLKWVEIITDENQAVKTSAMYILQKDLEFCDIIFVSDKGKKRKIKSITIPFLETIFTKLDASNIEGDNIENWRDKLSIYSKSEIEQITMLISEFVNNGKIRADKIESLGLTEIIPTTESTINNFILNYNDFEFQKNDIIGILTSQNPDEYSLYIFIGGDKSLLNNYLPTGLTKITVGMVEGLNDLLNDRYTKSQSDSLYMALADYVVGGKIRADKIEALGLTTLIEVSQTSLASFAANSANYVFEQNDIIAIPDGTGNFALFIFKGGTKTVTSNYLPTGLTNITIAMVSGLQSALSLKVNTSDLPTLNVGSATKLQNARTFTLGNTGKSFDGSANLTWTLSEIGAQAALTNPITGTGTTNYLPKFTTSGTIGNSLIYDNGTNVGIGKTAPSEKLDVNGNVKATGFKKANGTPNQALTADGGVFDLTTKADLVDGKVPSSQLPSYVDDVLEFDNLASFPTPGEVGKIYVAKDTNLTYRWGGTDYAEISASLALGETASTAYRGDRGKIAYEHSQTIGNPHNTTKADIGLGNVDNTSDLNKPVSILTQLALNNKVNKNPEIVSSTKTKITYDSKGLVIAGNDATTIDINDSIDRRYVTDVQLNTIQNTSGINTGDETTLSIQTKRPLKTINNESLEGSGNVQINYNDLDNLPTIVNDKNYVHNQIVASNFWEIQHNLGKYPSVSIVDSGNNLVVGAIKYIDSNNIIITFTSAFSGKAYFN